MKRKFHLIAGFVVGVLLYVYLLPFYFVVIFALSGSTFPDIDHPQKGWPLSKVLSHRGWIHSLFGLVFFTALLKLMLIQVGVIPEIELAFAAGYFTHLILDSVTAQGIMLFYPLKARV